MPKIQVAQAFTFTDKDGVAERFEVGQHSVSKEVAEHPYVGYHLAPVDPVDATKAEKAEAKRLAAEEKEIADKAAAAEMAEAQRIADAIAADAAASQGRAK